MSPEAPGWWHRRPGCRQCVTRSILGLGHWPQSKISSQHCLPGGPQEEDGRRSGSQGPASGAALRFLGSHGGRDPDCFAGAASKGGRRSLRAFLDAPVFLHLSSLNFTVAVTLGSLGPCYGRHSAELQTRVRTSLGFSSSLRGAEWPGAQLAQVGPTWLLPPPPESKVRFLTTGKGSFPSSSFVPPALLPPPSSGDPCVPGTGLGAGMYLSTATRTGSSHTGNRRSRVWT